MPEASVEVERRQAELDVVYQLIFGSETAPPPPLRNDSDSTDADAIPLDDDDIIHLAKRSRRSGAKFAALWVGQWKEHFSSQSEADSSVCFKLAYFTKDASQIDRIFRRSGLMREKWDERHGEKTYGRSTIEKALAKVAAQYRPPRKEDGTAKVPRPCPPPPSNPQLPKIVIDDIQLNDLTEQALTILLRANTPPSVFVRGGVVARVVQDENGLPKIEIFDRVRMRCRLGQVANFFTLRKTEAGYSQVATHPPLTLAENLLALGRWDFPPLAGIARAPRCRATDRLTLLARPLGQCAKCA